MVDHRYTVFTGCKGSNAVSACLCILNTVIQFEYGACQSKIVLVSISFTQFDIVFGRIAKTLRYVLRMGLDPLAGHRELVPDCYDSVQIFFCIENLCAISHNISRTVFDLECDLVTRHIPVDISRLQITIRTRKELNGILIDILVGRKLIFTFEHFRSFISDPLGVLIHDDLVQRIVDDLVRIVRVVEALPLRIIVDGFLLQDLIPVVVFNRCLLRGPVLQRKFLVLNVVIERLNNFRRSFRCLIQLIREVQKAVRIRILRDQVEGQCVVR